MMFHVSHLWIMGAAFGFVVSVTHLRMMGEEPDEREAPVCPFPLDLSNRRLGSVSFDDKAPGINPGTSVQSLPLRVLVWFSDLCRLLVMLRNPQGPRSLGERRRKVATPAGITRL